MKKFIFFCLSLCLMAGSITAQKGGFKLDRDEMGEVIEDIDFGFPWPTSETKFPGPIMKKFKANKAMIQKRYGLSDKEFNAVASQVLAKMQVRSAKELKMMEKKQMRRANGDLKFLLDIVGEAYENDNSNVQSQQSGAKDILDTGVSGAGVGAALGGGLGAAVGLLGGPKGAVAGAAIGAAVGGALGAAFGVGAGAGQEVGEELGLATEDN